MKPIQQHLPFTPEGKRQWRRQTGEIKAYEVTHGDRKVIVGACDGNDAKVWALAKLQPALFNGKTGEEREKIAQYIELRVRRREDCDEMDLIRGEVIQEQTN
jgi:hypothetical protein